MNKEGSKKAEEKVCGSGWLKDADNAHDVWLKTKQQQEEAVQSRAPSSSSGEKKKRDAAPHVSV